MVLLVINGFVITTKLLIEGITKSGQLSIRWIENKLNNHLNKVLKTDDDYVIDI